VEGGRSEGLWVFTVWYTIVISEGMQEANRGVVRLCDERAKKERKKERERRRRRRRRRREYERREKTEKGERGKKEGEGEITLILIPRWPFGRRLLWL